MERAALLVERTGVRLGCLLNPESLVWRRRAGLRARADAGGVITGHALSDDPVIATGGGVTEFDLDLLFDMAVARDLSPALATAEAAAAPGDVRDLTRPIWDLAETVPSAGGGYGAPPRVRLIWGRAWNLPGVVVAVAERLERFTPAGAPQRSWLRLRLRRVGEDAPADAAVAPPGLRSDALEVPVPPEVDGAPPIRLDALAAERYGDSAAWRLIAEANDLDDPLAPPPGGVLRLPPAPVAA